MGFPLSDVGPTTATHNTGFRISDNGISESESHRRRRSDPFSGQFPLDDSSGVGVTLTGVSRETLLSPACPGVVRLNRYKCGAVCSVRPRIHAPTGEQVRPGAMRMTALNARQCPSGTPPEATAWWVGRRSNCSYAGIKKAVRAVFHVKQSPNGRNPTAPRTGQRYPRQGDTAGVPPGEGQLEGGASTPMMRFRSSTLANSMLTFPLRAPRVIFTLVSKRSDNDVAR